MTEVVNETISESFSLLTLRLQGDESVLRSRQQMSHEPSESDNLMFNSERNPESFPDGGAEAYLVLFGSFIGLIIDFGIANSLGAIESYVSLHQLKDESLTSVSWIFSMHLGLMYVASAFFGVIFDKYGPKPPMIVGTVLMVAGLLLTAECQTVLQFILCFGILTALGTSLAMQALIGVQSHWFLKNRGLACSIATSGGLVGSSIFPVMLQSLYGSIGFKWALRVMALIGVFCMSVAIVLVKGRKYETVEAEEQIPTNEEPSLSVMEKVLGYFRSVLDFSVVKDPKFVLLTLAVALSDLISVTTLTYLSSFALFYDVNERLAYLLITIMNACGIPSRFILGYCADRYGRFNVMIVTSILMAVSIFAFWIPAKGNIGVLYAFGIFFGFASSAVIALIPACCGQICSSDNFGKVYGTMYFFIGITTLLGMYIASLITHAGKNVSYLNLVYFEGALSLVTIGLWFGARYIAVGWRKGRF